MSIIRRTEDGWSDDELMQLPSGLLLPSYLAEREIERLKRPTALDLFSGCGGFSLGVIQAGFRVVAGVDNDALAAITYMHNLGAYPAQFHWGEPGDRDRFEKALWEMYDLKPTGGRKRPRKEEMHGARVSGGGWISHETNVPGVEHFLFGDVAKLTGPLILEAIGMKRGELDLVMGSPPCQGFSFSGKRQIDDPRNTLIFDFFRLICELRPKTMVMENVPGVLSMTTPDGIPVLELCARILEEGDYMRATAFLKAIDVQGKRMGFVRTSGKKTTSDAMKKAKRSGGQKARPNAPAQPNLFTIDRGAVPA